MSLKPGDFVITDRLPAAPDRYDKDNEQRFRRILELTRFQGGVGGTRTTKTITTATLTPCETENGVLTIGYKSAMLIIVSANYPCRIRLYPTAALRTDDAGRPTWQQATAGIGVLLDCVISNAGDVIDLSPATYIYNGDTPVVDGIYYAIENRDDVDRAVIVSLTLIPMEG